MIDLHALREALVFEDGTVTKLLPDDAIDLIYEAARLVAEGREVRYCEAHASMAETPGYRCDHYRHLRATGNEGSDCRMVRMILIPGES